MESVDSREVELLISEDPNEEIIDEVGRNYAKDVHILSFAFLFVFLAYSAAQNLQSTINTKDDLGTTSLGILYVSFTIFSLMSSLVVKKLGSKNALVIGTTGYWLFMAANLLPRWYTMIPTSIYLGFAASIIWVGQGTYLTSAARSHARLQRLNEGTTIGNFNGEFWGIFACTQVIGNLLSLLLLRSEDGGNQVSGITVLYVVFLGSMTMGTVLMFFLSKQKANEVDVSSDQTSENSIKTVVTSIVAPLLDKRMISLIPLLIYSGLQQAFVWGEFTKYIVTPALGVSGVGGVMALYGASDAICSLVAGRLTSGIVSISFIIFCGALFQLVVLLWMLLEYRLASGVSHVVYPLLMAFIWGIGDAVFNTQINALLGILFRQNMESAFAQLKVWQSASTAVVFFLSSYIAFKAMLAVMLAALCVSLCGLLFLTIWVEKAVDVGF